MINGKYKFYEKLIILLESVIVNKLHKPKLITNLKQQENLYMMDFLTKKK